MLKSEKTSSIRSQINHQHQLIEIINSPVTALVFDQQIAIIIEWAKAKVSKYVCIANVHMLMESYWHAGINHVLRSADLITPDGMPLVVMMRLLGIHCQDRVAGMDVFLQLCKLSSQQNISIFFLGSSQHILEKVCKHARDEFPELKIAGTLPLPFRPITRTENEEIRKLIHESGAGLVFVSLGCPKQELWMYKQKGKIQATMIGLGGVFPVYAGIHKRAPSLIRVLCLEWMFRLMQEPGRLWKRYAVTIPPFLWLATVQILKHFLVNLDVANARIDSKV